MNIDFDVQATLGRFRLDSRRDTWPGQADLGTAARFTALPADIRVQGFGAESGIQYHAEMTN